MNKKRFGQTDLCVSEIGFGAWAIGGPAMAGKTPIGWGATDDSVSVQALLTAYDQGINFFDTADFYGLGHSEDLLGRVFGNRDDVIIATKVGHRLDEHGNAVLDYTKEHILSTCDASLRRLGREHIDYYQLHSAKLSHLHDGECIEAMERLRSHGKIRYWGISLNTYHPFPEADFMFSRNLGHGIQVAFNIINQRAAVLIEQAGQNQYGVIARMPLQFGLLTGKFDASSRFDANDHRHMRLKPQILEKLLQALEPVRAISETHHLTMNGLALSFIKNIRQVSTVIPGIRTPEQAIANTTDLADLDATAMESLRRLYDERLQNIVDFMEKSENQG